jgi:hypothetical protein
MRDAADLSSSGNYYDVLDAVEANQAVLAELEQASLMLDQAKQQFADVEFRTINEYLALKKEAVQLALESDQALVDADLETATNKNLEYGAKDTEAVTAASRIPPDPFTIITATYGIVTGSASQQYASARANAADSDIFIREYVGVDTQTAVQ